MRLPKSFRKVLVAAKGGEEQAKEYLIGQIDVVRAEIAADQQAGVADAEQAKIEAQTAKLAAAEEIVLGNIDDIAARWLRAEAKRKARVEKWEAMGTRWSSFTEKIIVRPTVQKIVAHKITKWIGVRIQKIFRRRSGEPDAEQKSVLSSLPQYFREALVAFNSDEAETYFTNIVKDVAQMFVDEHLGYVVDRFVSMAVHQEAKAAARVKRRVMFSWFSLKVKNWSVWKKIPGQRMINNIIVRINKFFNKRRNGLSVPDNQGNLFVRLCAAQGAPESSGGVMTPHEWNRVNQYLRYSLEILHGNDARSWLAKEIYNAWIEVNGTVSSPCGSTVNASSSPVGKRQKIHPADLFWKAGPRFVFKSFVVGAAGSDPILNQQLGSRVNSLLDHGPPSSLPVLYWLGNRITRLHNDGLALGPAELGGASGVREGLSNRQDKGTSGRAEWTALTQRPMQAPVRIPVKGKAVVNRGESAGKNIYPAVLRVPQAEAMPAPWSGAVQGTLAIPGLLFSKADSIRGPPASKAELFVWANEAEEVSFAASPVSVAARVWVDVLIGYLAQRDTLPAKADAVIVFGNEYLQGIFAAGRLAQAGITEVVIFTGGIGHSTQYLRRCAGDYLEINSAVLENLSEAEISYLVYVKYVLGRPITDADFAAARVGDNLRVGGAAVYLEKQSRNCQENVEKTRELIWNNDLACGQVILVMMPPLQRRAGMTFAKWFSTRFPQTRAYNHAAFIPGDDLLLDDAYALGLVDEIEKLEIYSKPQFGFIPALDTADGLLPPEVKTALFELKQYFYPRQLIAANGILVAGILVPGEKARTDINQAIQVETGFYPAGSSMTRFASSRYQAVLYVKSGKVLLKTGGQVIEIADGDIVAVFANADLTFAADTKYAVFRQTGELSLPAEFDPRETIDNEQVVGTRREVVKDGQTVADIYRDEAGQLLAAAHRPDMAEPSRMVMITPRGAAIGVGIKFAQGPEAAHRHDKEGLSRMEISLCRSGDLRAYLADQNGNGTRVEDLAADESLVLYPHSVHGYDFNAARIAVIIQEPGRGADKVEVKLDVSAASPIPHLPQVCRTVKVAGRVVAGGLQKIWRKVLPEDPALWDRPDVKLLTGVVVWELTPNRMKKLRQEVYLMHKRIFFAVVLSGFARFLSNLGFPFLSDLFGIGAVAFFLSYYAASRLYFKRDPVSPANIKHLRQRIFFARIAARLGVGHSISNEEELLVFYSGRDFTDADKERVLKVLKEMSLTLFRNDRKRILNIIGNLIAAELKRARQIGMDKAMAFRTRYASRVLKGQRRQVLIEQLEGLYQDTRDKNAERIFTLITGRRLAVEREEFSPATLAEADIARAEVDLLIPESDEAAAQTPDPRSQTRQAGAASPVRFAISYVHSRDNASPFGERIFGQVMRNYFVFASRYRNLTGEMMGMSRYEPKFLRCLSKETRQSTFAVTAASMKQLSSGSSLTASIFTDGLTKRAWDWIVAMSLAARSRSTMSLNLGLARTSMNSVNVSGEITRRNPQFSNAVKIFRQAGLLISPEIRTRVSITTLSIFFFAMSGYFVKDVLFGYGKFFKTGINIFEDLLPVGFYGGLLQLFRNHQFFFGREPFDRFADLLRIEVNSDFGHMVSAPCLFKDTTSLLSRQEEGFSLIEPELSAAASAEMTGFGTTPSLRCAQSVTASSAVEQEGFLREALVNYGLQDWQTRVDVNYGAVLLREALGNAGLFRERFFRMASIVAADGDLRPCDLTLLAHEVWAADARWSDWISLTLAAALDAGGDEAALAVARKVLRWIRVGCVVNVSPEAAPVSKGGGMANVVGQSSKALVDSGLYVVVISSL
ncbi:MAG: YdcF family protein, partial [Candidatus Omnitrophica bacterium]|nr:YdcF family protein [Candidatus Omnitrophota bacterium]